VEAKFGYIEGEPSFEVREAFNPVWVGAFQEVFGVFMSLLAGWA